MTFKHGHMSATSLAYAYNHVSASVFTDAIKMRAGMWNMQLGRTKGNYQQQA